MLFEEIVIDPQLKLIMSDGEPLVTQQSLSLHNVQPLFTLDHFSWRKRILTNEDNLFCQFWDYLAVEKEF